MEEAGNLVRFRSRTVLGQYCTSQDQVTSAGVNIFFPAAAGNSNCLQEHIISIALERCSWCHSGIG